MRTIKRRLDALKSRIAEPGSQAQAVKQISALMDELSAAAAGGEAQADHTLTEILEHAVDPTPQRREHPP
ncbi:hypothetical protein ACWKWV_00455 [Castellaniella ginsengisoli]